MLNSSTFIDEFAHINKDYDYKLVSSTHFRVTWLFESCASHACAPALHAILVVKTTIKCMLACSVVDVNTPTPRHSSGYVPGSRAR